MEKMCLNCQFMHAHPNRTDLPLTCRRSPPVWVKSSTGIWPLVQLTDWCGEFKEKPVEFVPREEIDDAIS